MGMHQNRILCVCVFFFFVCVSKETRDVKWNSPRNSAKAVGLSWQWKTDDPEPRKGLSASVPSIIPQQTCLSLCHRHSDACVPAFTRVQQLHADGTAKYNTVNNTRSQMSYAQKMSHFDFISVGMFQDAYQICAAFRRVHFFIFSTTRAYVQNPDSALSHRKPHKHNSSSHGLALFVEAFWCRTWQRCRMSPGVSCQSQRLSTPIHSPRSSV